jgi:hypothetical protein
VTSPAPAGALRPARGDAPPLASTLAGARRGPLIAAGDDLADAIDNQAAAVVELELARFALELRHYLLALNEQVTRRKT